MTRTYAIVGLTTILCCCTVDVELERQVPDARVFFPDSGSIVDAISNDAAENPEDANIISDAALFVPDATLDSDAGI